MQPGRPADQLLRKKKFDPLIVLQKLNATRQTKGIKVLSKSAIYRFVKGETHSRRSSEARVAKEWIKRLRSFWHKGVHAYDNKAFPVPLTPAQRKKIRQTRISGHLRKASEGVSKGFTKPKDNHSFLGMPSVTVTAAVAKDRIILWHAWQSPNGT